MRSSYTIVSILILVKCTTAHEPAPFLTHFDTCYPNCTDADTVTTKYQNQENDTNEESGVVETSGLDEVNNTNEESGAVELDGSTEGFVGIEWITIPSGTFLMGSADGEGDDDEHPQHEVTVKSFKISKTEVTVAQYRRCVDDERCSLPNVDNLGNYPTYGEPDKENHPVNNVSRQQAANFSDWAGGRLPSEAEWEYAARSGGLDIIYPWGNEEVTCEHAVIEMDESSNHCGSKTPNETPNEVCSSPLGNTEQGLCDMAGNLMEWVVDTYYPSYEDAPTDGSARSFDDFSGVILSYVVRGCSYNQDAELCRARDRRGPGLTDDGWDNIGFRVVKDIR